MVCNFDLTIHKRLENIREVWQGVWRPCQITVSREVWETPKFELRARHLGMEHSREICTQISLDCLQEVIQCLEMISQSRTEFGVHTVCHHKTLNCRFDRQVVLELNTNIRVIAGVRHKGIIRLHRIHSPLNNI